MENGRFSYQNLPKEHKQSSPLSQEGKDDEIVVFQEDQTIFLLNNLLISVQFFENYERVIERLRENWFKEIVLEEHHKKSFFADSLFRLVGSHVKFRPCHGINKEVEASLHPIRIFITDDNVEATYDPAALGQIRTNVMPFYQLTVRPSEDNKKDKSGYVSLVEFRTFDGKNPSDKLVPASRQTLDSARLYESTGRFSTGGHLRRKSTFDLKNVRRLTKTEKMITFQNKNPTKLENRKSLLRSVVFVTEDTIPNGGFYDYVKPEARLNPKLVHEFRMNNVPETSHQIPRRCFQTVEVKQLNPRRRSRNPCFKSKIILNSAALKAHFCDVLLEKLAEPLNLDINILQRSTVHAEAVTVDPDFQICVTPTVNIKDWNKFVEINKKPRNDQKFRELEWPTAQMRKILRILPCHAVPQGYLQHPKENVDFEKEWKLVFPKSEEFLLLHMMHAHLRCYFFILAIYKSFIENETNSASFGPKHLLHLFLWKVHKNFLAWPEDRLGETLLGFFKTAYKKLKNKSLSDFFITSRNLFAESFPKDLHRTQVIIKRILENPVPYVMRAIKNLKLEPHFYPPFDIPKLHNTLKTDKEKVKKPAKQKKKKTVRFEGDEEQQWKREAIKQIKLEKKLEEKEMLDSLSLDSISLEEILSENSLQSSKVVEIFICHFLEMGMKSVEYEALDQTLLYLCQIRKLLELLPDRKSEKLKGIKEKINKLNENCDKLKRIHLAIKKQKGIQRKKTDKVQEKKIIKKTAGTGDIEIIESEENENNSEEENSEVDEECETKL